LETNKTGDAFTITQLLVDPAQSVADLFPEIPITPPSVKFAKIDISVTSTITFRNQLGSITIDPAGIITLQGLDIKVGQMSLIQWLNNHTHIGNMGAPTSSAAVSFTGPIIITPPLPMT
jgi:hypothetical protein